MFHRKPPLDPAAPGAMSSRAQPARRDPPAGPVIATPRRPDIPGFGTPKSDTSCQPKQQDSEPQGARLTVGRDIHLKADIKACDLLIVEGHIEASIDCRYIKITEPGLFEGNCEIDVADISGRFNGTLVARDRLILRKTGRIEGKIRYDKIEIEPGGVIAGDIDSKKRNKKPAAAKQKSKGGEVVELNQRESD